MAIAHNEYLAVVRPVVLLRSYLERNLFTGKTYDEDLKRLLKTLDTSWRPPRWCPRLSKPELDIAHRAGIKCEAGDALL